MNKVWICLGCVALLGVIGTNCFVELNRRLGHANGDLWSDYEYYGDEIDYANSDGEEVEEKKSSTTTNADALGFKVDVDESGEILYNDKYDEAIKTLSNGTTQEFDNISNKETDKQDNIDDYQIEDNRSEVKEDKHNYGELDEDNDGDEDNDMDIVSDEFTDEEMKEMKDDQLLDDTNGMLEDLGNYDQELLQEEASKDVAENISDDENVNEDEGEWESVIDEATKDLSNKEIDNDFAADRSFNLDAGNGSKLKEVVDDIDRFFNLTEENDYEFSEDEAVNSDESQRTTIEQQHVDKTNRILNETSDSFDDEEENADESLKSSSTSASTENVKIDNEEDEDDSLDSRSSISTEKYTEEDTVSKAYNDLKDDLNQLRETWMKLKDEVTDANINKENLPGFDELDTKLADIEQEALGDDDYEIIEDKDLSKLFEEIPEEDLDEEEMEEIQDQDADEIEPTLPPAPEVIPDIQSDVKLDQYKLIRYVDDALDANDDTDEKHSDIESPTSVSTTKPVQVHLVEPLEETPIENVDIFDFHESEKSSADPIRITLDLDTPVVLTSPNYPSPYPTNAVIDWILEGEGRGIEFNVTDFALNSIAGDYVMVKPGRVDASGSDGFLLSHSLNNPRLFRFLDVNRVFIRFDSKRGLNRFRGFSFSAKMIKPVAEDRVIEPEPRPIGYPEYTITLNLGGVTLEAFLKIEEQFRQIVADMATMYIEANHIDKGLNTTLEVTQITSRALCFHNWPQFERCAEVRFGVPLQYEDEDAEPRLHEDDLRDMWFTFSSQDPFALRLQRLGIDDFQIPNDNNVLMVWLVIAAGVVISMAMLAFALWRFSCFEDYTRMPSFSDTESVTEKKALDLYPTPHQTLPPLYSDVDYKWGEGKYDDTTRVDMSGYPNRSYVRTEEYEFDSEDEVAVPKRDRYATDV